VWVSPTLQGNSMFVATKVNKKYLEED